MGAEFRRWSIYSLATIVTLTDFSFFFNAHALIIAYLSTTKLWRRAMESNHIALRLRNH